MSRSTQVAISVPFDNATNGFTSDNVQQAIETSRNAQRAAITTFFNATIAANQWLGYSDQLPGDTVPIRLPWACVLTDISMSWVGAAVDGSLVLYKNGTAAGNIVYTQTFTNVNGGQTFQPNITFAANDQLRGRWTDSGDNPSDMAVVYFFRLTL